MTLSLRDSNQALAYARHEHFTNHDVWEGMCLNFVRNCYGIPPKYATAWEAWVNCPSAHKHPGTSPYHAPVGAALCFRGGSKGYGHIMLAARPFPNGTHAAWSNDLVSWGSIDKVQRNAPVTHWGQTYVGYITQVNGVNLRLVS